MSEIEHKKNAPTSVPYTILTISDSRTLETDQSGKTIRSLMEEAHHLLIDHKIIPNQKSAIDVAIRTGLASDAEVILLNGGTGISDRDKTYEVVQGLLEKKLDGFGEIFRFLSYQEMGSAAILSRAIGGTIGKKAIFSMPGSTKAVQLAVKTLLLKEIPHVLSELNKK
ncbi:MAG: molybdenum cofactor biosynthesis protein B [Planctomycetota bacterium]